MGNKILLVMPQGRRDRLLRFLSETGVDVFVAEGVREAQEKLAGAVKYDLAFVDSELPDGSWRDVLQFIVASHAGCEMVVCSRCGDERLWAEVIQCGAFDLVPEPFETQEVLRIIHSALDSHYIQRFDHAAEARAC
ncbi:MAG: response regulator [Acidobacteria bacterium]|nr:response regulator [Acidobacteriota bacterium]